MLIFAAISCWCHAADAIDAFLLMILILRHYAFDIFIILFFSIISFRWFTFDDAIRRLFFLFIFAIDAILIIIIIDGADYCFIDYLFWCPTLYRHAAMMIAARH